VNREGIRSVTSVATTSSGTTATGTTKSSGMNATWVATVNPNGVSKRAGAASRSTAPPSTSTSGLTELGGPISSSAAHAPKKLAAISASAAHSRW
jgi:hypothetical protein